MKNTTPIPPNIASPDEVQTRLGTLSFFDGFPDDESVHKLYDNLDFQRALQSYLLALPAVSQVGMRKALTQWGPENSTLPIWENMITPRTVLLTTNNNTPYSWMWIDLKEGPLVAEIPPRVLGMINDMWGRWVVDVGLTGEDKGEGGKYLLVPPGYEGEVPEGYTVVRPRTFEMYLAWRSFLDENGDPKPHIDLIKQTARVYPLSRADNPSELTFVDLTDRQPFCQVPPADYTFWEYLNEVVQAEPSDSLDPLTLGLYRSIGIKKGKPFAPDERMKAILTEAAAVGDATARALAYRMREKEAYLYENSAWRTFLLGGYEFLEDGALVLDAYSQCYFLATGITPAEEQKMVGQGSQYAVAFVDADGRALDGAKNYKLQLPPDIPVNNFWSMMLYDNQTRSQLQTDQHWPALSSEDEGFLLNEDGSADVYFGAEALEGKENNWVQTVPGKGWFIALRLYGPLERWFDKTWRPGEIEPVT